MSDPLIQRGLNHLEQMEAANHKVSFQSFQNFMHAQGHCAKCPKPVCSAAPLCMWTHEISKKVWSMSTVGKEEPAYTQLSLFR